MSKKRALHDDEKILIRHVKENEFVSKDFDQYGLFSTEEHRNHIF